MSASVDSADVAALYSLLDDVAARAQQARPANTEGLSEPQELALLLFVATFEVYLGMRALLHERLAEEGRILSRTLLDDTARLIWLATGSEDRETRALKFTYSSIEYERDVYRSANENGYDWAAPALSDLDEELEAVKAHAEHLGVGLERLPASRQMLRLLNQGQLYYWHVRASQAIHSTRLGLSARFLRDRDDENRFKITLESPIDEVARVAVMAMQSFSMAIVAASDMLAWGNHDELVEYRERVVRLSGDLLERIKVQVAAGQHQPDKGQIDRTHAQLEVVVEQTDRRGGSSSVRSVASPDSVTNVHDDPIDRLYDACLAAIDHFEEKQSEGIDPDTFAELGESLFWLVALAEARGRQGTGLLRGLRWARNRVGHGGLLTQPVEWHYGSELGRMVLGRAELGTRSKHKWLRRDAIKATRTQRRNQAEDEAAYDEHVAGQSVLEVLRAGLADAIAPG